MSNSYPIVINADENQLREWFSTKTQDYLDSYSGYSFIRGTYNLACAVGAVWTINAINASIAATFPNILDARGIITPLWLLELAGAGIAHLSSSGFQWLLDSNFITGNFLVNAAIRLPLSAAYNMLEPQLSWALDGITYGLGLQGLCLLPAVSIAAIFAAGVVDGLVNNGRFFDYITETEVDNLDFLFSTTFNRHFLSDIYGHYKHGGLLKYVMREQYLFWFYDDWDRKWAKLTSVLIPSDFRMLSVQQEQIIEEYLLQFNSEYRGLRKDLDVISCMVKRGFNVNHKFEYRYHYDLLYRIYKDSKNEPFEYNRYFKDYLVTKFNVYKFDYASQQPQDPQYFNRYPTWELGVGETNLNQPLHGILHPEIASAAELYDFEFFVKKVQRVYDRLWLDIKTTKENAKREYIAKLYWPEWLVKNFMFDPRLAMVDWYTDKELERLNLEVKREPNFVLFHAVSVPLWWADMALLPTHISLLCTGLVGQMGAALGKWLRWYDDDNPLVRIVDEIAADVSAAKDRVVEDISRAWNMASVENISRYGEMAVESAELFQAVPSSLDDDLWLDW